MQYVYLPCSFQCFILISRYLVRRLNPLNVVWTTAQPPSVTRRLVPDTVRKPTEHLAPSDARSATVNQGIYISIYLAKLHLISSHSIKRRSAFKVHLKKHKIDPDTVDIDAMAPPLLPRPSIPRRRSIRQTATTIDFGTPDSVIPNIAYSNVNPHAYRKPLRLS